MSAISSESGAPVRGLPGLLVTCTAVGLLAPHGPANAQVAGAEGPQLEEIIVTAQKREESEQDVPVTMAVLTGADLEQQGLTDLADYAKFVPGLIYAGEGLGGERSGPNIVIRGIANSRLGDFETNIATATTGYVYGEVPAYALDPNLTDTQRVEILEGPQGTLYGAAAMGGLVKIVPNAPQFDAFTAKLSGGLSVLNSGWGANDNGYSTAVVVNAPLSDTLALRFSFHESQDPGYINVHLLTGNPNDVYGPNVLVGFNSEQAQTYGYGEYLKNVNKNQAGGGKVALRFKPNDQFEATASFLYDAKSTDSQPFYEPVVSTGSGSPLLASQFQLQPENTNYSLASLEMSYDFGFATLHAISGWTDRSYSNNTDFAGITYGALGGNGIVPLPTPAPLTFNVDSRLLSQELRLQGDEKDLLWSGSGLDWTVGGFFQKEERDAFGNVTVGPAWLSEAVAPLTAPNSGTDTVWSGQYSSTYTDRALFGDITINITPDLALAGGLRYSNQGVTSTRIDFSDYFASAPPTGNSVIHEPVQESKTVPRATLTYAVTKEVNLYATYSEGFRIGGDNPTGNYDTPGCAAALKIFGITAASTATFKSDDLKNYEVGLKTAWDNGRIIANISGFREDWSDLQSTIDLDQVVSGCGASFVSNAGVARIYGAEAEVRAALTEHWQVRVTGQYADGKIVEVVKGSTGVVGAPLQSAPKTQIAAGFAYSISPRAQWTATARVDYAYVGPSNFNNTNTPIDPNYLLPGYGEANVRFSAEHDNWQYTTYVNNLTNTIPELGVYEASGGPGNYAGAFAAGTQRFITTSAPRTFGVKVEKRF
jgi:iron complex outermembrane receptor protein